MTIRDAIIEELAKLTIRRQAEVDEATYALYAEDLEREGVELDDLKAVCWMLGKSPRQDYQSAFPDLGTILGDCRRRKNSRETLALMQANRERYEQVKALPPISKEQAADFLERIKKAAHGR